MEAFSRSQSFKIAVTRGGKALTAEEEEEEEGEGDETKEVQVEVMEEEDEEEEEEDEKVGEQGGETRVSGGASSRVLSSVTVSSRPVAWRVVDITVLCPELCV